MPRPASLYYLSLSTAFERNLESSLLSLDWVLASGLRPNNSVLCAPLCLPDRDSADCVWSLDVQLAIPSLLSSPRALLVAAMLSHAPPCFLPPVLACAQPGVPLARYILPLPVTLLVL
ncbi:hypothetical protein C8R44DRAFT_873145 [Mycena epipterygia]|nr:hypothetical protein C8R44DRAFT_873145 [Mycena epipterygia]